MFGSKKSDPKAPKFFCENCGAEVPMDGKRCPQCGRYFASIRCPACGFVGDDDMFKGGCPVCGYSSAGNTSARQQESGNFPQSKKPAGALPVWVYVLTAIAFIAVVIALFFAVLK